MNRRLGAAILLCVLSSCSYLFDVRVTPTAQGPRFSIGSVSGSIVPRAPGCAGQVVVWRAGERKPIWAIRRVATCPTARTFVYGIVPHGWEQLVAPGTLERGVAYEVSIGASGGSGGTRFLFDGTDLGRVRP